MMDRKILLHLFQQVADGGIDVEDAADQLSNLSFEDLSFAKVDHHRSLRKGFPEVVYGESKTVSQITMIIERMITQESVVLVTRVALKKPKPS